MKATKETALRVLQAIPKHSKHLSWNIDRVYDQKRPLLNIRPWVTLGGVTPRIGSTVFFVFLVCWSPFVPYLFSSCDMWNGWYMSEKMAVQAGCLGYRRDQWCSDSLQL